MAGDTIAGYIQGLLDGIELKQTAYALDRGSPKELGVHDEWMRHLVANTPGLLPDGECAAQT